MSIMSSEEFERLRSFKGKMDKTRVERILDEIQDDFEKSNDIKVSTIYVYSLYSQDVLSNKEFFDIVLKILEKYANKIGIENVKQLILNSI
ncbi:MAG: hypothetical protein OWQ54_03440 [Sulfolobaceae archaeon]|nr:hypothetical protein [Sulfolobaceae archaeon]